MVLSDTTVKDVATTVPKVTPVAPVKPAPEMITDVPPAAGPETGEISVMDVVIGAETALGWVTTKESESLAPVVDVTWALICCGGGVDVMHGGGRQVRHCRDAHRVVARGRITTGDGVVRARGWPRHESWDWGQRDLVCRGLDEAPQDCVGRRQRPLLGVHGYGRDERTEHGDRGQADDDQGDQDLDQRVALLRPNSRFEPPPKQCLPGTSERPMPTAQVGTHQPTMEIAPLPSHDNVCAMTAPAERLPLPPPPTVATGASTVPPRIVPVPFPVRLSC